MRTPLVIWLLLVGATLCSFALFESAGNAAWQPYANVAIILIAFVKVRWIGLDFMELRAAPIALRAAFEVWVVVLASTLASLYLLQG